MGIFKFPAPISMLVNKKRHPHRPQKHLMESIIASIGGASIPAILFYFLIWFSRGSFQSHEILKPKKNISSDIFFRNNQIKQSAAVRFKDPRTLL